MFSAGQQIGHYTLIQKLGRGGFGEVWLAEKRTQFITKKVAVKLPFDEKINFQSVQQEATLWEQASGHPNVLPIIDADIYDGQVVIVSEFAEGGSLDDKLKNGGKLTIKSAVEMTIGILNGLEFLHSKKIIHRDIKPANVLLQGGTPRLADFGVSRVIQTSTHSSMIIGTDAYMSPEAFDGHRNIQTDIWSVGVLLYELLTGKLPFGQDHPTERMFAVLMKDFDPLPSEIPLALQKIIANALAKKPENRYQNALQMRDDLQQFLMNFSQSKNSLEVPTLQHQNQASVPTFQPDTNYQQVPQTLVSPQLTAANQPPNFIQPIANWSGSPAKILLLVLGIGVFLILGGVGLFFVGRAVLNSTSTRNNETLPNPPNNSNQNNNNTGINFPNLDEMVLPEDQATLRVMTVSNFEELLKIMNQSPIGFETASTKLTESSSRLLFFAAAKLKELNKDQVVEIGCHTDNQGDSAKNLALSQSRAESIRKYLAEFGANSKLLKAKGYGATQPRASNETEEGRKKNRRVEFSLSSN